MTKKMNPQSVGLDIGLSFIKWLTGSENLHYGIWTDLDVSAENIGSAQSIYTDTIFSYLPDGPLRILDVGGGAGETARKNLKRTKNLISASFLKVFNTFRIKLQ